MRPKRSDSIWHGPLRLPDGVRPMVDRCDTGKVIVEIQYDPTATEDDLVEAEECVLAFIEHRRNRRRDQDGMVKMTIPPPLPGRLQGAEA